MVGAIKLGESAEDDSLVVGPGGFTVIAAAGVESVVDQVAVVDHAGMRKPFPFAVGPRQVRRALLRGGGAVCQMRGYGKEQLIGDGVFVGSLLAPPDAAGAVVAPPSGHVGKDGLGHVEIGWMAREVVGVDPSEGPPAFVVVILIDEAGRCL